MCRKMLFFTFSVLMIGIIGIASADEINWTNANNNRNWCEAGNWSAGIPGPDDRPMISSTYANEGPQISGCDANVLRIWGPSPGSASMTMDIINRTLTVQNEWTLSDSDTGTTTINITGNSVVNVLRKSGSWAFRGLDEGKAILNINSNMSGDPNVSFEGDVIGGDSADGEFIVNISGGRFYAEGGLGFGNDGGGELTISGGDTVVDVASLYFGCRTQSSSMTFTMDGGTLNVRGLMDVADSQNGDHTTPFNIKMYLNAGTLTCGNFHLEATDEYPDGIPFQMDIDDGIFKIKGQQYMDEMQGYIDNGWITSYGGSSTPDLVWDGEYTVLGNDIPQQKAYGPQPRDGATGVCPNVTLSWSTGIFAVDHNVYFGPSLDDVNGSEDPCTTLYGPDSNSWAVPSTLELNKTYYWRVDEINDPCIWEGSVWSFTTENGQATDPDPRDGLRGASPYSLNWTPSCVADQQKLYLGTSEPLPSTPQATLSGTDSNYAPALDPFEHYYWRVDTIIGSNTITGETWDFITGVGGLIMYYKFDGGGSFPDPIYPDETYAGSNIEFTKYTETGGSVTYGESNPMIDASTASANFEPNAGLVRDNPGEEGDFDALGLSGYQYTIEMWIKPESIGETAILINKRVTQSPGHRYTISITGDNEFEWEHNGGADVDMDGAVEGEWAHIAAVYDQSERVDKMQFYLNGTLQATRNEVGLNQEYDSNDVTIGMRETTAGGYDDFFDGLIDELRIYDIALHPCEFLLLPGPEYARCPSPADGEIGVDPCGLILSWESGEGATSHHVYFGTDPTAVEDRDSSVYQGIVNDPSFDTNDLDYELENGRSYFWAVDEDGTYPGQMWLFVTEAVITDAHLKVWYKFDETGGTSIFDSSGHGNDVFSVDGAADAWEPAGGIFRGCLAFDNDIGFDIPIEALQDAADGVSVSIWLYGVQRDQSGDNWVVDLESGEYALQFKVPDVNGDVYCRAGKDVNDSVTWEVGEGAAPQGWIGSWHHFVMVKDEPAGTVKLYFDSNPVDVNDGDVLDNIQEFIRGGIRVGAAVGNDSDYEGKMDDLRIYDYAISQQKVIELFRGGDLASAWRPVPYDGKPDVPRDVNLVWSPGDYATHHDIYFGANKDVVTDANTSNRTIFPYSGVWKGRRAVTDTDANIFDPCELELGQTYYWRIDEVDDSNVDSPWTGAVWSFTVANYITIDTFEDYATRDALRASWPNGGYSYYGGNGTGAGISLGTRYDLEPVYMGEQSLDFAYNNTIDFGNGYYSESERVFDSARDFTEVGVKLLTFYFHGSSDPAAWQDPTSQMYVGLKDTTPTYDEVRYGDAAGEDINDIRTAEWQEWNVPLTEFSLDLENISSILIGFGDRTNATTAEGRGDVYIDEIRLYPPKCVPAYGPLADFSGNCIVDYADIALMVEDWLKSDVSFDVYTDPGTSSLVGSWNFDSENGNDSSGNAHHGTLTGDYSWMDGHRGGRAVDFVDGICRIPDAAALRPQSQVSLSAWFKLAGGQNSARVVVKGANDYECYCIEVGGYNMTFYVGDVNGTRHFLDNGQELNTDEWYHAAGTYDANTMKGYLNGQLYGQDTIGAIDLSQDTNDLCIGNSAEENRAFNGAVDDVNVYNDALTEAEVAYVATDGTGTFLMSSPYNIYEGEPQGQGSINLRDLAVLINDWMKEVLWP